MSDSEEVIPEKKGRGRPATDKSDMVTKPTEVKAE